MAAFKLGFGSSNPFAGSTAPALASPIEENPVPKFVSTGALEAIESGTDSPLREADPDAINLLLDKLNNALVEGLPKKITDDDLRNLVDLYRAKAIQWDAEEAEKRDKPKGQRKAKSAVEAIEVEF